MDENGFNFHKLTEIFCKRNVVARFFFTKCEKNNAVNIILFVPGAIIVEIIIK